MAKNKPVSDYPEGRYEIFKLIWMALHGFTVKDLVTAVLEYRAECAENLEDEPDELAKLDENIFDEWEREIGFDGSQIWPCFDEFLSEDDPDLLKDGSYEPFKDGLDILKSKLPTAEEAVELSSGENPQLPNGVEGCVVKNGLARIDISFGLSEWPALRDGWKIGKTTVDVPYADYVRLKEYAEKRGFTVVCDKANFTSDSCSCNDITICKAVYIPAESLPTTDFMGIYIDEWNKLLDGPNDEFRFTDGNLFIGNYFNKADPTTTMTAEQVKAYAFKTGAYLFSSNGNYKDGKYDNTVCTIVRPLTAQEDDIFETGQMYRIQFHDGEQSDAFDDELISPHPSES